MFKFKKYLPYILLSLSYNMAFAEDIVIIGKIQQHINPKINKYGLMQMDANNVSLLKLHLSDQAYDKLTQRIKNSQIDISDTIRNNSYPKRIQLGMNNVPVLNQGAHGSCVTFAITAALDAVLGQGDYISQLCQLNLGNYLQKNSYAVSGWDGALANNILSNIAMFGVVNKNKESMKLCGTSDSYPEHNGDQDEIALPEYKQISESLYPDMFDWTSIVDSKQVFSDQIDTSIIIHQIKQALYAGDRVSFGMILIALNEGVAGAVGSYHNTYDTWVITPRLSSSMKDSHDQGGHAMLITGYDDNAIAKDDEGGLHRGLFTVRNSWGSQVGDNGDFYVSYDYLKTLIIEAYRIRG